MLGQTQTVTQQIAALQEKIKQLQELPISAEIPILLDADEAAAMVAEGVKTSLKTQANSEPEPSTSSTWARAMGQEGPKSGIPEENNLSKRADKFPVLRDGSPSAVIEWIEDATFQLRTYGEHALADRFEEIERLKTDSNWPEKLSQKCQTSSSKETKPCSPF